MGNTGVYYQPTDHVLEEQTDSEAGPGRPCKGLEWVVGAADVRLQETTTPLRSGPAPLSPGPSSSSPLPTAV